MFGHCAICGGLVSQTHVWFFTNLDVCDEEECRDRAKEYEKKKDDIIQNFVLEKERLLRPWKEKMEAELFLLKRDYLKGARAEIDG